MNLDKWKMAGDLLWRTKSCFAEWMDFSMQSRMTNELT